MNDMEEIFDQITLTLDDDSELLCDVLATFPVTVNGKEQMYIALLPTDAGPDAEIFLYRFIEDGDDIDLQNIEDDEEYEEYLCEINLDEDEVARFYSDAHYNCPYYRNGDEYKVVRHQM